eukprot:scaffold248_cov263-Chaetoceros_neogracile.AAC.24
MDKITSANYNQSVHTYYFMGILIFDVIVKILISDGFKATMSFVAVFFYLRFMIGSWFLATVGMLEMFLSLPLAWFTFSYVFSIKYFSTLNVLCVFIVAAIGADDIFVFMDAYRQSARKGADVLESLETRMSWVYRRSGKAMLVTSATTCSAFLCTIISPIAGTRSFGCCTCNSIEDNPDPTKRALDMAKNGQVLPSDRITQFYQNTFAPFILHQRSRMYIAIPVIAWIILSVFFTTKLQPTQSTEQNLDPDHPLQKGATILSEKFPTVQRDPSTEIHFIWGLEDVDRDGVRQLFDPEFVGKPSFVEGFEFNEQCQEGMLEVCDTLRTNRGLESLIKRKDGLRSVSCFVEELGAYNVLGTSGTCEGTKSGTWRSGDWQMASSDLRSTMPSFVKHSTCYAETSMHAHYKYTMGWDGAKVRYAGISFESNLLDPWNTLPEESVREQYDELLMYKKIFDKKLQEACQGESIMTDLDQKFIFMNNQKIYRTSAVSGSLLGVFLAFIVLLVSTRRFHIAFFATLSIASVLFSVLGSVTMTGWTLGTNEAILVSILAGFSVDYVVHLAHAYVEAEGSAAERTTEAFGDMGISVFSGMLTSVVASIPLFTCTLTFFAKFGTFLCLTIVFSWFFANFGFMSLLSQFQIPMEKTKGKVQRNSSEMKSSLRV